MLVGREQERQSLDRLLAGARVGASGVLVLVGEPGIGKSALLDDLAARAGEARCLRARGAESETEVPFGGLLELLRPALHLLETIPEPQRAALEGALALRPGDGGDRFAVGAATLSLLAAYAVEGPVLVLVDDVQWLDAPSAEALVFAVRRLLADPIAVVLATREDVPSLVDGSGLPSLRLDGLDHDAATALIERVAGASVPMEVAERLLSATAGNPLALLELAPDAARLAGTPAEAPVGVSTSLARAFLRRVEALPPATRRLLVLAAASDRGDLALLARAASALDVSIDDLGPAEAAGLVHLADGAVDFQHPLVRSAIYGEADAAGRREVHRVLAAALPDGDVDRRAWHLAAAALGPDAEASEALEQAASRARARAAYAVAATAYERAARLASEGPRRARILYAAADAAWLAGRPERAVLLLDEALPDTDDPLLAARIEQLHGTIALRRGPVLEGQARLIAAAERVAGADPELAVLMLAEAATAGLYTGQAVTMLSTARRAMELMPHDAGERARAFASVTLGMALILAGDGEAGAVEVRRAVDMFEGSIVLHDEPRLLAWAAIGPLFLRESRAGLALLDQAMEIARRQAAVGVLPMVLHHLARWLATADRWAAAEAHYHDALRLAQETGQQTDASVALAGLAWLEARQSREQACRAHALEADALCQELGLGLFAAWTVAALGELELGLGHPAAAVQQLEELQRRLAALGIDDVDLSPAPELIDAYLRLGQADRAAALLDGLVARATAKGQPWSLARAARSRGMLAPESDFEECFEEALVLHERTPDALETGRTLLAYGARLRRMRQRVRARDLLSQAFDVFDRLGAAGWAALAAAELSATGGTVRPRDASMVDALTPQELRIALLLASGRTTREAAGSLFLSPKTVEYHLRHVYQKLGIHSRDELRDATAGVGSDVVLPTPPRAVTME